MLSRLGHVCCTQTTTAASLSLCDAMLWWCPSCLGVSATAAGMVVGRVAQPGAAQKNRNHDHGGVRLKSTARKNICEVQKHYVRFNHAPTPPRVFLDPCSHSTARLHTRRIFATHALARRDGDCHRNIHPAPPAVLGQRRTSVRPPRFCTSRWGRRGSGWRGARTRKPRRCFGRCC